MEPFCYIDFFHDYVIVLHSLFDTEKVKIFEVGWDGRHLMCFKLVTSKFLVVSYKKSFSPLYAFKKV